MSSFPYYKDAIPRLTTAQMIEVDRLMIEVYRIELLQMMENAGRCLAILAKQRFLSALDAPKILVLAGTGGNGVGALVGARRLASWGFNVEVVVTSAGRMKDVPGHQLEILGKMNVPIHDAPDVPGQRVDLIIDGIIGYSLEGNPNGTAADLINWVNQQDAPVLSLDTPSGIDLTSGNVHTPVITAAGTLTLALPKVGLYLKNVLPYRGELYLGDISVPPQLYKENSLQLQVPPLFVEGDVLQID